MERMPANTHPANVSILKTQAKATVLRLPITTSAISSVIRENVLPCMLSRSGSVRRSISMEKIASGITGSIVGSTEIDVAFRQIGSDNENYRYLDRKNIIETATKEK